MANKQYLDFAGLQKYDALIKGYVDAADANAIKYGVIEDGYLKLYKAESPAADAAPDFALALPDQHLSGLPDVDLADIAGEQALVYDATSQKWVNRTLSSICFLDGATNELVIEGGNAADLT